jgi:DNA-binding helix-hairpin-helix protein with protein kinase domain
VKLQDIYINQQRVSLGKCIGRGGEGEVFALAGDESRAIKLYAAGEKAVREQKILAMVQAGLASKTQLVAFPIAPVTSRDGRVIGFVMRLIADHKPLHELYSPGSRKHHFPRADYRFLVRAASNVARAVASVHQAGCVIGDINHSGILVSERATAALIDADSFQISTPNNRFLCQVGVPEYTPPELQGKSLPSIVRTPNHDAFGLAIVIFQLLFMGRHPFVGSVRSGETPPLHEAIRDYRFVYAESRDVGMDQPPGTPAISDFGNTVAAAFEIAFSREHSSNRPAAAQWIEILEGLEKSLVQCRTNALHFGPRDASDCPWCDMESTFGTYLFIPYVPNVGIQPAAFDPGAAGFDLGEVWARIQAVPAPRVVSGGPTVIPVAAQPSEAARQAMARGGSDGWLRVGAFILAALVLFGAPQAWIIWFPLALYAFFAGSSNKSPRFDQAVFTRRYIEIETRWNAALGAWRTRCGLAEYESLIRTLEQDREAYSKLATEERTQLAQYQESRRKRQLNAYLDNFEIRSAEIKGIGPAKEAVLASYGIETAADVEPPRLLTVPGFGHKSSQGLITWRAQLERGFRYSAATNEADRQELGRIRGQIESRAATLRRSLLAGPQNLSRLAAKVSASATANDPVLNRIQVEREQIRCDLKALGIATPYVTPAASVSTPSSAASSGPTYSAQPTTGAPAGCPRCGSHMVRRTARRGRYAGNQFWGCSRYPRCKGTRA